MYRILTRVNSNQSIAVKTARDHLKHNVWGRIKTSTPIGIIYS